VTALLPDDRHRDTVVSSCPDWTVADLCAHLAGVSGALVVGDLPGADVQAWVDGQVATRRGRSIASLLDEWATITPAFQQLMVSQGGRIAGLLYDIVVHEHDLRGAIGQPGARESRGVVLSLGFGRLALHSDMKRAGPGVVEVVSADGSWRAGEAGERDAEVRLDLSDRADGTWELLRLLGSRRSRSQVAAYPWQGDWTAIETGLFHMPLPAADLIE